MIKSQRIVGKRKQRGAALVLFVLMAMAFGAVALTGLLKSNLSEIESSRFKHNKRVLEEAKQALLMYAYNYPNLIIPNYENLTPSMGPGRLPCPDNNNDGLVETFPDYDSNTVVEFSESVTYCSFVGRFPWNEPALNFYDARDADNQRLWYAVSEEFRNIAPVDPDDTTPPNININSPPNALVGEETIVNSESSLAKSNITIIDQTGQTIYRGNIDGIAAVIIAPGPPINRDNDGDGVYETAQNRAANENNPENYLDTFNNYDNSVFNSGQSDTDDDGFILGPIKERDPNSPSVNTIVVNDQIIVVRAEEVIAMAEKATLHAYRNTINDYRKKPFGYCLGEIPDGETTEAGCLAAATPGTWLLGPCLGEIPDGETTEAGCLAAATPGTWIIGPYPWLDPYNSDDGLGTSNADITPVTSDPVIGRVPSLFGSYFVAGDTASFDSEVSVSLPLTYPASVTSSVSGDFSIVGFPTHTIELETVNVLTNVGFVDLAGLNGRLTGAVVTAESFTFDKFFWAVHNMDPSVDDWTVCGSDGELLTDCPHALDYSILQVTFTFDFIVNDILNFDTDYNDQPSLDYREATSTTHAQIEATFDGSRVISLPVTVEYEFDRDYLTAESALSVGTASETGTLNVADLMDSLTLGVRYYPELPAWTWDNEWHNSILMAYSSAFQPGGDQACTPPPTFPLVHAPTNDYCLALMNSGGITNNKAAILVLSGADEDGDGDDRLVDGGGALNYFSDDLGDIFEGENSTDALPSVVDVDLLRDNLTFDRRPANGNDVILILE